VHGLILLAEIGVLDLVLAIFGAGVLGFKVETEGMIFLRVTLAFGEEEVLGTTPLLCRL